MECNGIYSAAIVLLSPRIYRETSENIERPFSSCLHIYSSFLNKAERVDAYTIYA